MHCFRFSKHQTTLPPRTTRKQARFYKPCIYDNQLGFNKPAVVFANSLFAVFRHLCFNDCLCYMRQPFKVGYRNKHTANRRRSPINKHLSKIIVFTIRQRKITRPKTTRINIICILHPFHVQNHNYVNNTPIVLQPSSIAEKDPKHNNRPQKTVRIHKLKILPFFPNISSR